MNQNPKYLNLLKIKLPMPGATSILHRLSGLLMIISLPLVVWIFGLSIQNEAGFSQASGLFSGLFGQLISALLAWALAHHIIAGIRFLLIDIDLGVNKKTSLLSAYFINITSLILLLIFIGLAFS